MKKNNQCRLIILIVVISLHLMTSCSLLRKGPTDGPGSELGSSSEMDSKNSANSPREKIEEEKTFFDSLFGPSESESVDETNSELKKNEKAKNPNDRGTVGKTIGFFDHNENADEKKNEEDINVENLNPASTKAPNRLGLFLGPGLFKSMSFIGTLRILEKNKISIDGISGTEFGAIVAAMYASGLTPEMIEWNFYKYFKEKREDDVFSPEWIKEVDEFLLSKFKNTRVEMLKKYFYIPLYSKKAKKVVYFEKGNLRNLLLLNLKNQQFSQSDDYLSSLEYETFHSKFFKSRRFNTYVGLDVLGNKISFQENQNNDPLNRLYLKVKNGVNRDIQRETKDGNIIFRFNLEELSLDAAGEFATIVEATKQKNKLLLERLRSLNLEKK